jgi:hypothetical protein
VHGIVPGGGLALDAIAGSSATLILHGTFEISAAIALIGIGWPVFLMMRARRTTADQAIGREQER